VVSIAFLFFYANIVNENDNKFHFKFSFIATPLSKRIATVHMHWDVLICSEKI
jgi:hypothetical protein